METYKYEQILQASILENKVLRQQIVKNLRGNGFLVIQNVPEFPKISKQLSLSIEQLNSLYQYSEMKYSNLGLQKQEGTLIYANNNFPLQNQEFIKKVLNLKDDESPEILKRIELNQQIDILQNENEFSLLSRSVFSNVLKLIDLESSESLSNNTNEEQGIQKKQQNYLAQSFEKSEVQKYKCILQNGEQDKVTRYISPDFGLGSLIMIGAKDIVNEQSEPNTSFIIKNEGEEESRVIFNDSDVIVTCGELLSKLSNGYFKQPSYLLQIHTKQGKSKQVHQQFFYLNFSFEQNNLEQKTEMQIQNISNNKLEIKKQKILASQYIPMSAHKIKIRSSDWIQNFHDKIIGHLAKEYIQTLSSEELYPQIQVKERQFHNQTSPIRCFNLNLIDSTMNIAKFWKKVYVTENMSFAFLADQQFKGQGQNKNTWKSPLGNCYVTFLVKYEPMLCYCISQLTAISVVETLDHFILPEYKEKRPVLKWINDVFVNEKKISGVLCRVEDEYLSIGIGVNLNHNPTDIPGSTCLREELNLEKDIDILEFVQQLWNNLSNNLKEVQNQNSFIAIINKVEGRMLYLNEKVKIYDQTLTNVIQDGIFRGLNEYGNAMLENLKDTKQVDAIFEGRMRPF